MAVPTTLGIWLVHHPLTPLADTTIALTLAAAWTTAPRLRSLATAAPTPLLVSAVVGALAYTLAPTPPAGETGETDETGETAAVPSACRACGPSLPWWAFALRALLGASLARLLVLGATPLSV